MRSLQCALHTHLGVHLKLHLCGAACVGRALAALCGLRVNIEKFNAVLTSVFLTIDIGLFEIKTLIDYISATNTIFYQNKHSRRIYEIIAFKRTKNY